MNEAIPDRIESLLKESPSEVQVLRELVFERDLAPVPEKGSLSPGELVDLMFRNNPELSLEGGLQSLFADLENQSPSNVSKNLPDLDSVKARLW